MTAPCSAAWQDHSLPYSHHCGLDEGHEGLHVCAACTQLPAGRVDTGNRVGGDGAARPELSPAARAVVDRGLAAVAINIAVKRMGELVTAECGPFWAHEDCEDPGCTCHCHESGGSGS